MAFKVKIIGLHEACFITLVHKECERLENVLKQKECITLALEKEQSSSCISLYIFITGASLTMQDTADRVTLPWYTVCFIKLTRSPLLSYPALISERCVQLKGRSEWVKFAPMITLSMYVHDYISCDRIQQPLVHSYWTKWNRTSSDSEHNIKSNIFNPILITEKAKSMETYFS